MSERPRYLIEVEMLPGDVPQIVRFRRMLKGMLRGYGAKVNQITPLQTTTATRAADATRRWHADGAGGAG
jgi:hypothetical protein